MNPIQFAEQELSALRAHMGRSSGMTKEWLAEVSKSMLGYRETGEATYDIARSVLARGVPGDFVECGVYQGAHCAIMARAILDDTIERRLGDPRPLTDPRVHLFDSFEGMPAATEVDQEIWQHHGAKTGDVAVTLGQVKANMIRWGIPDELLVWHPGMFDITTPMLLNPYDISPKSESIALLRLDADLYTSTSACMKYLYPLVSQGGWVIVDDWNLSGCRKAVQEIVIPAPVYWRVPVK